MNKINYGFLVSWQDNFRGLVLPEKSYIQRLKKAEVNLFRNCAFKLDRNKKYEEETYCDGRLISCHRSGHSGVGEGLEQIPKRSPHITALGLIFLLNAYKLPRFMQIFLILYLRLPGTGIPYPGGPLHPQKARFGG